MKPAWLMGGRARFTLGIIAACMAGFQAEAACPPPQLISSLIGAGSVYIGEVHGTIEGPGLVQCLVEKQLEIGAGALTVSLEVPPTALSVRDTFWTGKDGRSSQAMFSLLQYLKHQQDEGRLHIHFQTLANDSRTPDNDERVGRELQNISKTSRVIALSGNNHNRRSLPGEAGPRPSGDFIKPGITTIALVSLDGGDAWTWVGDSAAVHTIPKSSFKAAPYELIDGKKDGYDLLLALPSFHASRPEVLAQAKFESTYHP